MNKTNFKTNLASLNTLIEGNKEWKINKIIYPDTEIADFELLVSQDALKALEFATIAHNIWPSFYARLKTAKYHSVITKRLNKYWVNYLGKWSNLDNTTLLVENDLGKKYTPFIINQGENKLTFNAKALSKEESQRMYRALKFVQLFHENFAELHEKIKNID
jgi:hypothetical protein